MIRAPARDDVLRGRLLRMLRIRAERVNGQDAGARRDPQQPPMGRDRAGHAGPVLVRFVGRRHRIELPGDRAGEIRVGRIDERINDGDGHI